ncbi:VRR-NUC domain-containing protein [Kocuria rhizophila]|uniref:VRR-NUC domain-containing protein n=1 Tax=Kocuria rhizophila TaxID=72000 RepID=UPI001ED94C83|nr:VRR-NUC domain-containing protein [Kocuria rhizophila]
MRATDHQEQMILSWKEAQLQNHVVQMATALGWEHYHTHDSRRSPGGFPDLVLVHPRKRLCLMRELKTERGRFRPKQEQWLENLHDAGVDAGVWRPSDVVSQRVHRELSAGTGYGTGSMGGRP